jgi:hypothetical protein
MWVDRKTYDDQRLDNAKAQTEARVLSEQNRALQVTLDWFRVRITQLEMERAQLLFNYTGVKVPTPTIQRAPEGDIARALQAVQGFQDIGDDAAQRLGIGWNPDGTLKEAKD